MALPPGFVLEEPSQPEGGLPPGFQLEPPGGIASLQQPPAQPEGGFIPAVQRGFLQTGILLGDILPAMVGRAVGADEYAERQFKEAAETQRKIEQKYAPAVPSYKDIKGVGDAVTYAVESVGELVPSILPSLFTGGVAGVVGRGAVIAAKEAAEAAARKEIAEKGIQAIAEKEVMDQIRKAGIDAASKTALKYQATGAVSGSALQNLPEVYQNIKEETGQESLGSALLFGGFNSLLDAALPISLLAKARKAGIPGEEIVGAWYKRFGIGATKGFATEGATEAAQEMSSAAAEKFVDNNIEFFSEKNLERFINAGLKGGLGGGVVSGTTDVMLGKRGLTEDLKPLDQDIRDVQSDILARRAFLDELRAQADEEGRNKLDSDALKDLGFGPKYSLYESLLDKDINDPAQAQEVINTLQTAVNAPDTKGRERVVAANTLDVINQYLETRGAPDVGQVVEEPSGAGVSVPAAPVAPTPAEGLGAVERTGVVPPVADVGAPVGGEGLAAAPVAPVETAPVEAVQPPAETVPAVETPPTTQELITQQETELAAQMDKFQNLLQEQVRRFGLKDVAVKVATDLKDANAQYTKGLIKLAVDAADPVRDLRHESVHALKELGFFTPAQWNSLVKQAQTTWINTYLRNRNVDGGFIEPGQTSRYDAYIKLFKQQGLDEAQVQEALIEEAISDAFGDFNQTKAPPGMIKAILERMKNFFKAIKETVTGSGVTDPERLFGKIERGEQIGQVRPSEPAVRPGPGSKQSIKQVPTAGRPEPTGDRGGRDEGRVIAPLAGAPVIPEATGPDANLVKIAEEYAKRNGIPYKRQASYVEVDEDRAKRIAQAYEDMPHAPQDPAVKEAYADLIRQTRAQYDALIDDGYEFTFFDSQSDPYGGNPFNAMRDLRKNKRMAVYGTYDGFGTEGITDTAVEDNPMLADTGLRWKDQAGVEHMVTANDLFRAVHDAFGHGLEGAGFRARGEENAWQAHARLFTGPAVGAITSETRGQNSWLNFGPYGEKNRTAKVEDTVFAEQKTGLMPSWTWGEGKIGDEVVTGPKGGVVLGELQPGATTFEGLHYGNAKVDSLSGAKYGTGIRGAERRRLEDSGDDRIKRRVYFYIPKTNGQMPTPESGLGPYIYTQKFDNILGPGPEMSRLFSQAQADSNAFESAVVDAGYDGYAVPNMGMMVILNHDAPVKYQGTRADSYPKFSLRIMRGQEVPEFEGRITVDKIGKYFDDKVKAEFGRSLDYNNPEDFARALKIANEEVDFQLKQEKSGLDWYEDDVRLAFEDTAKVIPKLDNAENRVLFSVIAGIMSPQTTARDNWFIAAKAYQHYVETGDVPGVNPESGKLWQGGTTSVNKRIQLEFLDRMIKDMGQAETVKWLLSDHTVKEINQFRQKYGNIKSGIDGKLNDVRRGLFAFGPKVGPFVSNLNGIHDVTVDQWMIRTFNRYFGTMIGPDGQIIDAPTEPQRRAVKDLVNKAAEDANIKPYQVQSLLWFYEQRLYDKIGLPTKSYGFSDGGKRFLEEAGGRGGQPSVRPAAAPTKKVIEGKASIRAPRSEEFRQFIAGSKAVDADGNPIVYYHGSLRDKKAFRPKVAGAIFFSPDPSFAEGYIQYKIKELAERPGQYLSKEEVRDAVKQLRQYVYDNYGRQGRVAKEMLSDITEIEDIGKKTGEYNFRGELGDAWRGNEFQMGIIEQKMLTGRNITPVYISVKDPFDYEDRKQVDKVLRAMTRSEKTINKLIADRTLSPGMFASEHEKIIRDLYRDKILSGDWRTIELPEVQEAIRSLKHDGFYAAEEHTDSAAKNLAVYDSKQVVSATGNVGPFRQRPPTTEEAARVGMEPSKALKAQEEGDIRFSLRSSEDRFNSKEIDEMRVPGYKSKEKLIEMPIRDFLQLAEEGYDERKMQNARKLLAEGKQFSSIPFLGVEREDENNPSIYKTVGHEGRHRARALEELGYKTIPVILKTDFIRWSEQNDPDKFDYREVWPSRLKAQKGAANPYFSIPFPVRREDSEKPYGETERKSLRSQIDPAIVARILQTTAERDVKTFPERITNAIGPESRSRLRAMFLNRYNRLGEYDKRKLRMMGGAELLADANAESAALMSDVASGVVAGALGVYDQVGGVPVYNRHYVVERRVTGARGTQFIQVGGRITSRQAAEALARRFPDATVKERGYTAVTNLNNTVKGPIAIFAPLAKLGDPDAYRAYQYWAGVKRGSKWMTNPNGTVTEKLFEAADVPKAEKLRQDFLARGVDFNQIQKEWIAYNDQLVQYLLDTGVISKENADKFRKHGDYLPFYRQINGDDDAVGPRIFQSIAAVKAPRKIKGGEDPLGDFLENVVRNTQSAVQAGLKNVAARRAADIGMDLGQVAKINQAQADAFNSFYVLENGQKVFYNTDDPLFIESIKSLGLSEFPGIGLLAGPAGILRNLVTKDPGFMLANMMRDSLAAWTTSGVDMVPIAATLKNFTEALAGQSPEFKSLLMSGVIGGYDYSQGTKDAAEQFGKELRKVSGTKTAGEKALTPFTSLWDGLEKGTQASDAATRMEIYKKTLKETGNEAEALFRALEVMNFNRKGNNPIVRVATAAIPFLNARMQGLDVLYRAGFGANATQNADKIQKAFWTRGMYLAALSTMYWLLTHDDEEYKKQEQETRDNNWLFPSLGIRVPIPFEVGVLFKVVPERIAALTLGEDTPKDFLASMGRNLASTLALNPIPQAVLPLVEATTNFSFFTFRPIVGQGMEGVAPAYQVGPGTSRLAELIAEITKGAPSAVQISPMKLDQIIQGYTGTIGSYMSNLFDAVYDMHTDNPKASMRFEQLPVVKRFVLDPDARGQVTAYYDMKNAVDEATRTANLLERSMNWEEWGKYYSENVQMFAFKDYILDMEKTMKEYRDMKNMVRAMPMSADQKRDSILAITQLENQLTSNIQTLKKQAGR